MTIQSHSPLELICTACMFVIAFICFFVKYKQLPFGFSYYSGVAFAMAGIVGFFHAILSYVHPSLLEFWVPYTWGMERIVLAVNLLIAVMFAGNKVTTKSKILAWGFSFFLVFFLLLGSFYQDLTFVHQDSFIKRPLDGFLVLLWTALIISYWKVKPAFVQAPRIFYAFLCVGVASHLFMAIGSANPMDFSFALAHYLKLIELMVWMIAECILAGSFVKKMV